MFNRLARAVGRNMQATGVPRNSTLDSVKVKKSQPGQCVSWTHTLNFIFGEVYRSQDLRAQRPETLILSVSYGKVLLKGTMPCHLYLVTSLSLKTDLHSLL